MTDSPVQIQNQLQRIGEAIFRRKKELPVLVHGSAAWSAWRQWRVGHGLTVALMDRQERWTVPLEFPPLDLAQAEAEHVKGSSMASMLKAANG